MHTCLLQAASIIRVSGDKCVCVSWRDGGGGQQTKAIHLGKPIVHSIGYRLHSIEFRLPQHTHTYCVDTVWCPCEGYSSQGVKMVEPRAINLYPAALLDLPSDTHTLASSTWAYRCADKAPMVPHTQAQNTHQVAQIQSLFTPLCELLSIFLSVFLTPPPLIFICSSQTPATVCITLTDWRL